MLQPTMAAERRLLSVCLLGLLGLSSCAQVTQGWEMLTGGRTERPRCVDIPANLSLCRNVGYRRMRLPNLLGQETLPEAVSQAASWMPLLRLSCHPDAQLFLCSLFAPVCLEREIRPCRSLCQAVQGGCETRMQQYGFPWPRMLECAQFPVDHDMCIKPRTSYIAERERECASCSGVATYENILDHFCRSDIVAKVKTSGVLGNRLRVRRGRMLKPLGQRSQVLRGIDVFLQASKQDCPCNLRGGKRARRWLVTGSRNAAGELVASLVLPWEKNGPFRKAVRMFRKLNCRTLGTAIRERARREYTATPRFQRTTSRYHHRP